MIGIFRKKKDKKAELLTPEEAADMLNVTRQTLYNYKKAGKISYRQYINRGRIWIPKKEVMRLKKIK